jgi:2-phospho-L-lactate guanylyltransferase (CobY/MobA/RfbA family)
LLRKPFNLYETSYDNNSYYEHIQSSKKNSERTIIINSVNLSEDLDTLDDFKRIITQPTNKLSHLVSRITNVIG